MMIIIIIVIVIVIAISIAIITVTVIVTVTVTSQPAPQLLVLAASFGVPQCCRLPVATAAASYGGDNHTQRDAHCFPSVLSSFAKWNAFESCSLCGHTYVCVFWCQLCLFTTITMAHVRR